MNRKSKVIVSIVGITIVLLALLGITYAYYLTRIQGNTNTNSISITTADLKLEYGDGTVNILTKENIMPDNNNPVGTKDFTVSNTGNTTIENYKVVLEYAVIENVVPSVYKYPNDFEITLTCVSKNIETNEISGTCSGTELKWDNESVVMVTNKIDSKIRHEYSLVIYYKDSGIDQSDDMGKNLNLKVQIYGENETSTVTGTIDNVDTTYAMKLNSNPKISTIKKVTDSEGNIKYQYKFIGVEPNKEGESHTLTLVNKSNVTQSTGNITIKKGTNATIDGSTITVKDNQTNIYITTTKGENLTSTATFNPYSDNTNSLAYHIINNSINKTNGTEYRDNPLTNPAVEISVVTNYKTTGEDATYANSMSIVSSYASKTWYYYDTYEVDTTSGNFTLSGKQSCIYNSCYSNLVGKYLYSNDYYYNSNENNHTTNTKTNLTKIYKVTEATSSSLKYVEVFNSPNEAERVLAPTTDDYGTSYYYRGDVEDNYVNFAGMCWRIVRIGGDGSTKLILEDQYTTCDDDITSDSDTIKYTGNWSIGTGNYGYENKNVDSDLINESLMNYLKPVTRAEGSMVKAFYDFQTTKLADYTGELKSGDWCLGAKAYTQSGSSGSYTYTLLEDTSSNYLSQTSFYYDAYTRLTSGNANGYQPTLKCNGTILNEFADVSGVSSKAPMYVSAITADEIVYAGGKYREANVNYYLFNLYQKSYFSYFWALSPLSFFNDYEFNSDLASTVSYDGSLSSYDVYDLQLLGLFRPSVSLKSSTVITGGEGTLEKPYVIETE